MSNLWYRVGCRYFKTDFCGFNEFVVISFHDGHIVKRDHGYDVAVTGHTIARDKIHRFLEQCEFIEESREHGIPSSILKAVYKDLPVPEFRKNKETSGEQFCLSF
jgi:hypothetical protein